MEVVKQRRQTSTNRKHTSTRILMHAWKSEGLRKVGSVVLIRVFDCRG
jgi:hypothetical protein